MHRGDDDQPRKKHKGNPSGWEQCCEEPRTMFHGEVGDVPNTHKMAGFDMDGTLIATKSGRKFANSRNDWKWLYNVVVPKLREVHKLGYKIVIITNQAGVTKGKTNLKDIQGKIEDILNDARVPGLGVISTGADRWRKPSCDIWQYISKHCNGGVKLSKQSSFYIGDAGGRPARFEHFNQEHYDGDFSCSDRKFAANCEIDFQTPEEFFYNAPPQKFNWGGFNPPDLKGKRGPAFKPTPPLVSDRQEILVCVGLPGCGKTSFCKSKLVEHGYKWVNQDTLKTEDKCVKMCEEYVRGGSSVVVDNTNVSREKRNRYLAIANKHHIECRCLWFKADVLLCQHLNIVREIASGGKHKRVPEIAYNTLRSRFQIPSTNEGFAEVKGIEFVPEFNDGETDECKLRAKRLLFQFTS